VDLGKPISYLVLEEGTNVYSADGDELGRVTHVLAAEEEDIFDGIVLDSPAGGHRFADAAQVEEIYERGVVLRLDSAASARLPEPSENPAALSASPDDVVEGGDEVREKLRRAWERLSGRY
jgi:hypothetical protein